MDETDGHVVVIAVNRTKEEQRLTIRCGGGEADLTQQPKSVAAYLFTPGEICKSAECAVVEPVIEKEAAWDISVTDICLNGEEKAGEDLMLSAIVKNVGDLPTPEGAVLRVQFSLNGDCNIAAANIPLPVVRPGECIEAGI